MRKRLEKRERMQAEDFVREARSYQPGLPPRQLLQLVSYKERVLPDTLERDDHHAAFRASVLDALKKTLSSEDRALIRFLLEQEMAYHERMWSITESIRLCAFLLFVLAHVEDVRLLWEAKTTSFDTLCGLDIQFLLGAGVARTLEYLQQIQEEWAQNAKQYIEQCGDLGDLDQYRNEIQRHFQI